MLGKVPRENGLSDSLLVRLRNQYRKLLGAASQAHQSELLINYRCHSAIVRLPSRLFYDCSLKVCMSLCESANVYTVHVVYVGMSFVCHLNPAEQSQECPSPWMGKDGVLCVFFF